MFCPKCGTQNPETGKFCRSCGTDLGNVSQALSSPTPLAQQQILNHKGKPISYESALGKLFMGVAFLAVTIALVVTGMGRGWWFWMLIPAFGSLGAGLAQWIQIRKSEGKSAFITPVQPMQPLNPPRAGDQLPAGRTEWAQAESQYKTGDLVPPSVTEGTTRHLEVDREGQTMTLPKK